MTPRDSLEERAVAIAKYHEEHAGYGGASREFHERAASFLRALASPAAAPAAETVQEERHRAMRLRAYERDEEHAVPPSEPTAPEKEIANLLGRGHVRNPREGEPGDAETYSSPAPLLPRVLAALEIEASPDCSMSLDDLSALAAELRQYIAKAKGEGT